MKKTIAYFFIASMVLTGCSSRDDLGDGSGTSGASGASGNNNSTNNSIQAAAGEAVPGRIRVLTTAPTLQTGGSVTAKISALVTDESNRAVADQKVTFSSDGGVLQNIIATTTETGEATAELNLAGDYRNRNISVTARVGAFSDSVLVAATGSVIEMTAPGELIIGDTAQIEFKLIAGDGQPIPNQSITLASKAGNFIGQSPLTSDANGVVSDTFNGVVAGPDTITAVALDGTVNTSFALAVAADIQDIVTPVRVRVISNESSIQTGGSDVARITTLVTDDSNRVLGGKEVLFASTGGVLQNISSITNDAGQATAELSLAGDYRNQQITVTAEVDDEVGSVLLATSGSRVSISGPQALVSGNTAQLEVTLTGGDGQPIANELLSITSRAGNTITEPTMTTDSSGKALVVIGSAAGDDDITVAALDSSAFAIHAIKVAADILTVLDGDEFDELEVNAFWPLRVLWESNGQPMANKAIKFTTTAGLVRGAATGNPGSSSTTVNTGSDGIAIVEIKSSSAGPATIAFADADDADPFSQFDVEFVAFDVALMDVSAAPASVAKSSPSTISAIVTDDFGNPVKNVVVEFSSPDLKGGTLSPVTAVTDSDGKARVTFTAGSLPTQIDEIEIVAAATDSPAVNNSVRMTITERQLNVIIGLAGLLEESDSDTRYRRAGVVQVTDGAGRPVPDATILVTLTPTIYRYGTMVPVDNDGNGIADSWAQIARFTYACNSEDKNGNRILENGIDEDLNSNGVLDSGEDANGNGRLDVNEDINGNGILDPRDPALIDEDLTNRPTVIGGEIRTDSNGVGFFSLAYAQSNALWFDVSIVARVQALGAESVAQYDTGLWILAADVDDPEVTPPNVSSPYGPYDSSVDANPVCEPATKPLGY